MSFLPVIGRPRAVVHRHPTSLGPPVPDHRARALSPGDGGFARVVARRRVLLVRTVVFFVDDDDAEIL